MKIYEVRIEYQNDAMYEDFVDVSHSLGFFSSEGAAIKAANALPRSFFYKYFIIDPSDVENIYDEKYETEFKDASMDSVHNSDRVRSYYQREILINRSSTSWRCRLGIVEIEVDKPIEELWTD